MSRKIRVGLLFGGKSSEHEVSLASAASVIAAIDREKYDVVLIGISKDGRWLLSQGAKQLIPEEVMRTGRPILVSSDPRVKGFIPLSGGGGEGDSPIEPMLDSSSPLRSPQRALGSPAVDVVFPVLHGRFGEDGTIQGLLELAGIPYVSGGVLASAVGMDKDVMKRLFREAGLPVAPFITFSAMQLKTHRVGCRRKIASVIHYPCFVKPANSGSSVGIHKVHFPAELDFALDDALAFDEKVLVEKAIEAREIECSVLGNDDPMASLPGEIVPAHEFYDYGAKYIDEGSRLIIPAPLTVRQKKKVQELALLAFRAIDGSGMARVDFFLEKKTLKILINEINTIPGFTKISMYPKLWEASGISYTQLIDRLIQLAVDRNAARQALKVSYETAPR